MKVKQLIDALKEFDPESDVRVCVNLPGQVSELYDQMYLGVYEGRPILNTALDLRGSAVYVGFVLQDRVNRVHKQRVDLGRYTTEEDAARVHDFYVVHKEISGEPLNFPDFDYDKWIPPRTVSGEYNEQIAEILKRKLLE